MIRVHVNDVMKPYVYRPGDADWFSAVFPGLPTARPGDLFEIVYDGVLIGHAQVWKLVPDADGCRWHMFWRVETQYLVS